MLHVAELTGRRPAMVTRHPDGWIDQFFEVTIDRVNDTRSDLCPCAELGRAHELSYKSTAVALRNLTSTDDDTGARTLLLCGWTQSWRYTVGVEQELRRHLRPRREVADAVRQFLEQVRPRTWPTNSTSSSYVRVGIHARVGDVADPYHLFVGYTVPGRKYFRRAMRYAIEHSGNTSKSYVQFVVTSDSVDWCNTSLNLQSIADGLKSPSVDVDLVYSKNHSAGFDMVLLSSCDVVIMTTGTFGWWAAWLADKRTIYYRNWPRPYSPLSSVIQRSDFFPKQWHSIGGPYRLF
jgi:hypothetical protein